MLLVVGQCKVAVAGESSGLEFWGGMTKQDGGPHSLFTRGFDEDRTAELADKPLNGIRLLNN